MKKGKTAAFIAAAFMAFTVASVSAGAEETAGYSLLSAPISEISGVKSLEDMGGGYYLCSDVEGARFKIIYIGEGEISKWRETGKLAWKDVECGLDLENYCYCGPAPSNDGNCFGMYLGDYNYTEYYYCESSGNHTKITAKPFDIYWAYVRPDGYVFANQFGHSYFGKGTELNKIDFGDVYGSGEFALNTGEYIGGVFSKSDWYAPDPEIAAKKGIASDVEIYYAALRLADMNGNVTEVYSTLEPREDNYCSYISWDSMARNNSALHWRENYMKDGVETQLQKIYCFQSGELLIFPYNTELPDGRTAWIIELEDGVFDGIAIMRATTDKGYYNYVLTDTETGEFVSDVYLSLSTRDGEHFLANDENSGWTLIDSDGNQLCDFEDVTEFYGGIAMACDKGEGFLIDGNMEKISDTVPAESAFMGNDENIFISSRDGEYYFVTFVKNGGDTEIPETGNVGVLTLIICMAASGLAAVKTRKAYNERK